MRSLRSRLSLIAAVVLTAFIGLAIFVLEQAFRQSSSAAVQEHLKGQLYGLLSAAEMNARGQLVFPAKLAEPRFALNNSGLYGFVFDDAGKLVWQSRSSLGVRAIKIGALKPGEFLFSLEQADKGAPRYFVLSYSVVWEYNDGEFNFVFTASEDDRRVSKQLASFRRSLFIWGTVAAVLLLLLQVLLLHWGLRPLQSVAREVAEVEAGKQALISNAYPIEISKLTDRLNGLILGNRRALERYRSTLGNLAHSLKTPLAVLSGVITKQRDVSATTVDVEAYHTISDQVGTMREIIDYQLQRAAAAGSQAFAKPQRIHAIVSRLTKALDKVYRQKGVKINITVAAELEFAAEEGDLMELCGNLLDNAYKWCQSLVSISAKLKRDANGQRYLELSVEDDGPGIKDSAKDVVLQRGGRADERKPGHGIGLAVVEDIATAFGGEVVLLNSRLGGALVQVKLPIATA